MVDAEPSSYTELFGPCGFGFKDVSMKPSKAQIVESLDKACKILAGELEDEPDDPENPDDAEAEAAVSQATHSNDDEEVGLDEDDEAQEAVKPASSSPAVSSDPASSSKVSEVKSSAAVLSKGLKMDAVPMPKAGTKRPVVPAKLEQPEKKSKSEKPSGKKKFDWTDPSDDEKEKKTKKEKKEKKSKKKWMDVACFTRSDGASQSSKRAKGCLEMSTSNTWSYIILIWVLYRYYIILGVLGYPL